MITREIKGVLPAYEWLRWQVGVMKTRPLQVPIMAAQPRHYMDQSGGLRTEVAEVVVGYRDVPQIIGHVFRLLAWGPTKEVAERKAAAMRL